MNLLSIRLGNNMQRARQALSVFVVMLFGLVCVSSAPAQKVVSRFAYVGNAYGISIYTVNAKTGQLRTDGYVSTGAGCGPVTVDPSEDLFTLSGLPVSGPTLFRLSRSMPVPVA
jgi:hypothetical protein